MPEAFKHACNEPGVLGKEIGANQGSRPAGDTHFAEEGLDGLADLGTRFEEDSRRLHSQTSDPVGGGGNAIGPRAISQSSRCQQIIGGCQRGDCQPEGGCRLFPSLRSGTRCRGAGFVLIVDRWCRRVAPQPPATSCQASGLGCGHSRHPGGRASY